MFNFTKLKSIKFAAYAIKTLKFCELCPSMILLWPGISTYKAQNLQHFLKATSVRFLHVVKMRELRFLCRGKIPNQTNNR